jgi:hypothetical protein
MSCKGVLKPECNPPTCLWADGSKRKFCRSKVNKAKKSPKAKTVKARKSPKAKPVKARKSPKVVKEKVEKWRVTKIEIFFPEEGEGDITFNLASIVLRNSKDERIEYNFKEDIITIDDDEKRFNGKNYKLNDMLHKETSIKFEGFKIEEETSDLGSIHDGAHGLVKRGIMSESPAKIKKQHLTKLLQDLLI